MKRRMTAFLLTLLTLYGLLVVCMYTFQRSLLYHPDKHISAPEQYGLQGFRDLRTTATDGVEVQLWYRDAAEGYPTILYYHGNASHIGDRAGILAALAGKGFGLLALSYRGYGKSGGEPTEQGIYHDARAAVAFLTRTQGIPLNRILFFGESLGTGVAVQMATEYQVAGLILQAAYTSVAARAAEIYFYIPVQMLIKDRFDSLRKIAHVKAPLLLFHGERDLTIPVRQGEALFAAATSPKRSFYFPDIAHNDFDSGVISAHVLDFAKEQHLITPAHAQGKD